MTAKRSLRIVLVDDHQMLRDGLRTLLESKKDLEVSGEAGTGQEAVRITKELKPDVVILDLGLPDINGLNVIDQLQTVHPGVKVIVLSMHVSREHVSQAIEAGVKGYIPKSSTHSSLIDAIHIVDQGESFLHPKAASALMQSLSDANPRRDLVEQLSEREREVVRFTAMGLTSREAGLRLKISPKTVDTYRARAMNKLDISQRPELIRFALQAGLLDDLMGE